MISMKLLEERENPILKKKDVMLELDHKGLPTPKKTEVESKIAEHFKTDVDKVEVVFIFSEFGQTKSKVKARVWKEKVVKKEEKKKEPVAEPTKTKEGENEA